MAGNEDKKYNSIIKRDAVLGMIREELSYDASEYGIGRSISYLKQASEYMKNGWVTATEEIFSPLMGLGDGYMTREDRDMCWQELKLAWDRINDRQKTIRENNFNSVYERLYPISDLATYGDPFEALKEIKSANLAMKGLRMEESQFKRLRSSLDEYWKKATYRIEERKQEGRNKRLKWESEMKDKISRLSSTQDKISNSIDKLKSQREKLKDMRENSRSYDYKSKVDGWIDEVDDKINACFNSLADIDEKIRDIKRKLD